MHRISRLVLFLLACSPAWLSALRIPPKNTAGRIALLQSKSMDFWMDNPTCNQNSPLATMAPGIPIRDDTFGMLIANQMFWRLPGLDAFAHGFNIFTGTTQIYPIFQFCYPENSSETFRVQDTYRGNVYELPLEVYAAAKPQCTFSMVSTVYSSSQEMASSMAESTGVSASAGGGGSGFGFSGSFSFSYSQDQSVSVAEQLQSSSGGSLIQTSVECLTSSVQLDRDITSFHPNFVNDLNKAQTGIDMANLMILYGTHYYISGELGGKLTSVTSVSNSYASRNSEAAMSLRAEASFSASASGWGFSASASGSYSYSNDQEKSAFEEFEQESTSSYVMSYGGAPGTFGPTNPNDPANWGSWAKTVDLLPIPINYQVARIYDIIPRTWKCYNCSEFVYQLWEQGEALYYVNQAINILKKQLGADNMYKLTVTTNTSTMSVGAGPYGFRLNSAAPPNPGYTTPPQFFERYIYLNATTKGGPYALQPYFFLPSDNFTTVIRQVDMGELSGITLCTADQVAPGISWNPLFPFSNWGVSQIMVEDTLRSRIYPVTDFTALSGTGCVNLTFGNLPDSIKIIFDYKSAPPSTKANLMAQFTVNGTSGVMVLYYPISSFYNILMGSSTVSFYSSVDYPLGVLNAVRMDILVSGAIPYGPGNVDPYNFTIQSSTFRIEYTHSNNRMAYKGLAKGTAFTGIGYPLFANVAPTGLVFPAPSPTPSPAPSDHSNQNDHKKGQHNKNENRNDDHHHHNLPPHNEHKH